MYSQLFYIRKIKTVMANTVKTAKNYTIPEQMLLGVVSHNLKFQLISCICAEVNYC